MAAKMELLDSSFATAMLGFWLASILVASAVVSIDGDLSIMLWSSFVGAVCALGYWGGQYIPKRTDAGYAERYSDCIVVLVAILGSLWGVGALYYLSGGATHNTLDVFAVLAVMIGITTAATGLFACSRPVVVSFLVTLALPIWGFFLWNSHPFGIHLVWGIPLYLGMLMIFAHHSALATERAINLRFENQDLLTRLQQETDRSSAARKEAETANREKSVTLASASHDQRQPLHALSLFLIALRRTDLSDKQRTLLGHIEASSSAAQEMLHTLMDYSRLDTGSIRPRLRDFPIQALLYKLERVFAPGAEARNLIYRSRDSALWACADPNLVEQILRNLIANAIRYTEHGGLLIGCRKRQGQLVCEVWDSGSYKEAEELARTMLDQNANSAGAWLWVGKTVLARGQFDEAERHLARATEISPNLAEAWTLRGIVAQETGNHTQALKYFSETLRLQPNQAEAYFNIGYSQDALGNRDEAGANWRRFLDVAKDKPRYAKQRVYVEQHLGAAIRQE